MIAFHAQAVDIEDIEESKQIQEQAYGKIRKLKEWKKSITDLSAEIEEHLYVFLEEEEVFSVVDQIPSEIDQGEDQWEDDLF